MQPAVITDFWFNEIDKKLWFIKDKDFDQLIIDRFSEIHQQAIVGELYSWRKTPRGRLAEIIILDQFSRNMFRNMPQAFSYDSLALVLSQEAISAQADLELTSAERNFLYMPFMHSESPVIHAVALDVFANTDENTLNFEMRHKKIIDQFGRYPHRNTILKRESTAAELEFLNEPGSSF